MFVFIKLSCILCIVAVSTYQRVEEIILQSHTRPRSSGSESCASTNDKVVRIVDHPISRLPEKHTGLYSNGGVGSTGPFGNRGVVSAGLHGNEGVASTRSYGNVENGSSQPAATSTPGAYTSLILSWTKIRV